MELNKLLINNYICFLTNRNFSIVILKIQARKRITLKRKNNYTSKVLESLFWKGYWIVLFFNIKAVSTSRYQKEKNYVLTVLLTKMLVVFHCIPFGYVNSVFTFLTSFCMTIDHYYFLLSSLRVHEEHFFTVWYHVP